MSCSLLNSQAGLVLNFKYASAKLYHKSERSGEVRLNFSFL